jgi:hypothetical protein
LFGSLAEQVKSVRDRLVKVVVDTLDRYQRTAVAGVTAAVSFSILSLALALSTILALLRCPEQRRYLALFNCSFSLNWLYAILGLAAGGLLFAPAYMLSDTCSLAMDFGASPRELTGGNIHNYYIIS